MTSFQTQYQRVHDGRGSWSVKGINQLAMEGIPFEDQFRRQFNYRTPALNKFKSMLSGRCQNPQLLVWPFSMLPGPDGNMASNDHILIVMKKDRRLVSLGTVETECRTQKDDWGDRIPRSAWPYGLTLLTRKNYRKNLFFIKHNRQLTSAFCVECNWLVARIEEGKIEAQSLDDNLARSGIVTNTQKWPLSWDVVDANLYGYKSGQNRDGHIALVESNQWHDLWIFIADKLGAFDKNGDLSVEHLTGKGSL
jgi:hypothetical protein